jgi:hypothetical protein
MVTGNSASQISIRSLVVGRAQCVVGGSFTKLRCRINQAYVAGPATGNDIRMIVLDSSRNPLAATVNLASAAVGITEGVMYSTAAGNALYTLTLNANDWVWLGFITYWVGTPTTLFQCSGLNLSETSTTGTSLLGPLGIGPQLQTQSASQPWTGGATISSVNLDGTGKGGHIPWVELVA